MITQRTKIIAGIVLFVVVVGGFVLQRFLMGNLSSATSSGSIGYYDQADSYGIATKSAGLAQAPSYAGNEAAMDRGIMPPTPRPGGGVAPEAENRLIIQTGTLSVVVDDVRAAVDAVTRLTTQKGGFVVSSYISEEGLAPTAYITVRIPAKEFAAGVDETKKLGEVKNEQVSGQDVTAEYVDLDAQIRNLRATETQFLTIMQKATEIQDILAVQRELSNVRGQIEQIQGRMKYLSESASLSTLTINLSTDAAALPVVDQNETWKPLAIAKDALRSLLDFGKSIVNVLIWFAVYIPLWVLLGLVGFLVYRFINKMMKGSGNLKQ